MTTVKISELPLISQINANTANTLFAGVDIPTSATFRMTAKTIAQGLYSNEILNVGTNQQNLPNTVAQFSLSGESYIQTNLVNTNDGGSADIVVTANTNSGGTDATNFIDMGYANKYYKPGLEFNNIGNAIYPLDGYLYVQGTASSNGGNLIIGTTTSGTNLRFIVGGGTAKNVVAKMTSTGLTMNTGTSITFADGSVQTVAGATADYSQAAFALANTLTASITYQSGVNITQNTAIASTDGKMQSAYNKANTALANTPGVITAGDMTVSGNLGVIGFSTTGLITVNAIPYSANTPAFKITGSANNYSQTPLNQGYMLQVTGFANTSSRIVNDAFGANNYPVYVGRQGRGSSIVPAATQNGDVLLRISGNGWANSFSQFGQSRIDFVATENFTDSSKGTQIQFFNTKPGTNTLNQIASFNADTVTFTGVVNPTKGFIWTPNVYTGAQTAITIDFANNSVIRTNTSAGLVVSFTNYTAGKVVDMWITNTSANPQSFTHGCSALNATVNGTSYNIPGQTTIYAKYMSFDGDVGNTFVAITHA